MNSDTDFVGLSKTWSLTSPIKLAVDEAQEVSKAFYMVQSWLLIHEMSVYSL